MSKGRIVRSVRRLSGAASKIRDAGGVLPAAAAAWRMIRREGVRSAACRISGISHEAASYANWVAAYDTPDERALDALIGDMNRVGIDTLISVVVPVFNTPERYLREMIESVKRQRYPHWELCIADDASTLPHVRAVLNEYARNDARIRVAHRSANGHISEASNSALELARGPFIALLDHDDVLPAHALAIVAKYIRAHPDGRLFYSDEDKISEDGRRHTPHFKPDYDPELILQHNVFSHLGVFETELVRQVGGFRAGLEGSQDHDLLLRCVRAAGNTAVVHIPHVLYHWRTIKGSTAISVNEKPYAVLAAVRAVSDHLKAAQVDAEVVAPQAAFPFIRVDYGLPANPPSVHAVIAQGDDPDALKRCVGSILARTAYANFRVSIVCDPARVRPGHCDDRASLIIPNSQASGVNERLNDAVDHVSEAYLCFVDEQCEITDANWIDELMKLASQAGIGAAGASLWRPDGTLHAGGLVLTSERTGVPIHGGITRRGTGYFGRAMLTQTVSALSWSCAVVSKSVFLAAGGFSREEGDFLSRDVGMSLRIAETGLRNAYVPRAGVLIHTKLPPHRESAHGEAIQEILVRDRAYNPNLALGHGEHNATFTLSFPPRVQWSE